MREITKNKIASVGMVGAAVAILVTIMISVLIVYNIAGSIDASTIDADLNGTPAQNATDEIELQLQNQLESLERNLESGLITEEEYQAQKEKLEDAALEKSNAIAEKQFEVQHQHETSKIITRERRVIAPHVVKTLKSPSVVKNAVVAPIAGRIVLLKASVGQKVRKGDCICILEAMKMYNDVITDVDGKIAELLVSAGDSVVKNQLLVRIER